MVIVDNAKYVEMRSLLFTVQGTLFTLLGFGG